MTRFELATSSSRTNTSTDVSLGNKEVSVQAASACTNACASSPKIGQNTAVNAEAVDPDLRQVIDTWADLPDAIRAAIVAMVASTSEIKESEKHS